MALSLKTNNPSTDDGGFDVGVNDRNVCGGGCGYVPLIPFI